MLLKHFEPSHLLIHWRKTQDYTYNKGIYNTCQTAQGESFTFLFVIQNSICILAGSGALLNFPSLWGKEVLKDGTVKHTWTQASPVLGNFTGERHLLCWNSCSPELIFKTAGCLSLVWDLVFPLKELTPSCNPDNKDLCGVYHILSAMQSCLQNSSYAYWFYKSNKILLQQVWFVPVVCLWAGPH